MPVSCVVIPFVAPPLRHSSKPPLDWILEELFPPSCASLPLLEIFARNLRAGWVGVGDQALLFQRTGIDLRLMPGTARAAGGAVSSGATGSGGPAAADVVADAGARVRASADGDAAPPVVSSASSGDGGDVGDVLVRDSPLTL